jgi:hypothetical protein
MAVEENDGKGNKHKTTVNKTAAEALVLTGFARRWN